MEKEQRPPEPSHSKPGNQNLDQLFKEVMRASEVEIFGPTGLYSAQDADVLPTRLAEPQVRESLLLTLNECLRCATRVYKELWGFVSNERRSKGSGAPSDRPPRTRRLEHLATCIAIEIHNSGISLSVCADKLPAYFGDVEFRAHLRHTLNNWLCLTQHIRGQIRSILSHLEAHGQLIEYAAFHEERR